MSQALDHPLRPDTDHQRDSQRRPAEVLALMGIGPGMQIADLMAGGGWYPEILARVVGSEGRIYSQNNRTSRANYGSELDRRIHRSKLANIVRLDRELEEDDLASSVFDPAIRGRSDRFVFKFRKPA